MQSVQSYATRDGNYIENNMFKETPKSQVKYWTRLQAIHLILNPSSQPTQPKTPCCRQATTLPPKFTEPALWLPILCNT